VRPGCCIDKLRVHPYAVAAALYAAFHHIAHAELAADHPSVDRLVLEGERGIACDDEGAGDARQIGCQAFGNSIDEIVLLRIAAEVGEGKHDDGQARRGRQMRHRAALPDQALSVPLHGIGAYRARNVLQTMLAQIDEFDVNLAADLIMS
jgi:hypothetical protein